MKRELVKAWVTKYALTTGIQLVQGEVCADISATMLLYGRKVAHGNDWHRTPEAALIRAEQMRQTKISAMKKSLAKLEHMTFKAPNVELRGAEPASSAERPS